MYFVSLGTGKNQIPLLLALKNLNIGVIGIDANPNSCGKKYCDIFYHSSILDIDNIFSFLKSLKTKKIIGIYSRSYGKAVQIANELSKELNLNYNPPESLQIFSNKRKILSIAIQHSDLKIQRQQIENIEQATSWIIKPVSSFGKQKIQYSNKWDQIKPFLKNSQYIVEPFYDGKEYIFFGFIIQKQLHPIILTQKETINLSEIKTQPNLQEFLFCDRRHWYPSDLSPEEKFIIFQICNYIIKKTNLYWGPFLAEFIVKDGIVYFIEAAPEVGGEMIADSLIPYILDIPYFEFLAQIFMNQNLKSIKQILEKKMLSQKNKSMLIEYIFQKEGKFTGMDFPEELFLNPYYYFHSILKEKNTYTKISKKNLDRIGAFALAGETSIETLQKYAKIISNKINIHYK